MTGMESHSVAGCVIDASVYVGDSC